MEAIALDKNNKKLVSNPNGISIRIRIDFNKKFVIFEFLFFYSNVISKITKQFVSILTSSLISPSSPRALKLIGLTKRTSRLNEHVLWRR